MDLYYKVKTRQVTLQPKPLDYFMPQKWPQILFEFAYLLTQILEYTMCLGTWKACVGIKALVKEIAAYPQYTVPYLPTLESQKWEYRPSHVIFQSHCRCFGICQWNIDGFGHLKRYKRAKWVYYSIRMKCWKDFLAINSTKLWTFVIERSIIRIFKKRSYSLFCTLKTQKKE